MYKSDIVFPGCFYHEQKLVIFTDQCNATIKNQKKIHMINFKSTGAILLTTVFFFLALTSSTAQKTQHPKNFDLKTHHEVPDDVYNPALQQEQGRSPAYHNRGSSFFTIQVNVDEYGDNILDDAANETSLAIDPADPDKMVIGWRQFDHVTSNFRQAGYAYTLDGGESWTFPGKIEAGIFRSDPVLSYDKEGNIYYNSLTVDNEDNFWCNVFIMEEGSTEWDEGTFAQGGDKQWMEIDRTEGVGSGNIYAYWTVGYSYCYPGLFTRSEDGGASYEDCIYVQGEPQWGTLTVGAGGELYIGAVNWQGFVFTKSLNAQDEGSMILWTNDITVDLGGYIASGDGPNPGGLLGQTWIGVDNSDGPYSGNVYMLCSVDPYGNDPLDVMLARSTDGGETWDAPVRVNDDEDTDNWQWFGTMSVAPNGRIDVVWLDTRDAILGSYESSLYYSYSVDGGQTFSVNERVSELFDPHVGWPNQQKMGDYFHMISDECCAHLAWANTLNGEQDVYYTRIDPWFVGIDDKTKQSKMEVSVFPNPASGEVSVRYRVSENGRVKVELYDIYGKLIKVLVNDKQTAGQHTLRFNGSALPAGVYTCRVKSGSTIAATKITILK
ncbi:MAG: hypothetical protein DRJ02_13135 [Bacteroidetes bacterium]|nr:MAG: hypothetical protein DRJ02_13135 [Bacteroidota bacterium]